MARSGNDPVIDGSAPGARIGSFGVGLSPRLVLETTNRFRSRVP